MEKILELINKNLNQKNSVSTQDAEPDVGFVPYACHFNEDTILTKNGDLLQVIKITGFNFDNITENSRDLRNHVRKSVQSQIQDKSFFLYFHTIRDKKNLDPGDGKYDNVVGKLIHDSWCKKNFWRDKYVNELYITIIVRSDNPFKINNVDDFFRSFSFRGIQKKFVKRMEKLYEKLNRTSENLIKSLGKYGARKLEIKVDEEGAKSELLKFLGKISFLDDIEGELPVLDLSEYFANSQVAFGNNVLEVSHNNNTHYASIYTIKEYQEVSTDVLDRFLQLPLNFIVTQTFGFVDQKSFAKDYEYSNYILGLTGSKKTQQESGIADLLEQKPIYKDNDYGLYQLSIMIYSESLQMLQQNIDRAVKEISLLGFSFVREDLNLEEVFWSQLPANSHFICRRTPLNVKEIAGFASLHNFPHGKLKSRYGKPITVFRTNIGTPYFFNFHEKHNSSGHSVIIGPKTSGKKSLVNFLLSESTKLHPQICAIYAHESDEIFFNALGGDVWKFTEMPKQSKLFSRLLFNPFLEDLSINSNFLACQHFILAAIYANNVSFEKETYAKLSGVIKDVVSKIAILPNDQRNFDYVYEILSEKLIDSQFKMFLSNVKKWCVDGEFSKLITSEKMSFVSSEINLFDLSEIRQHPEILGAVQINLISQFVKQHKKDQPAFLVIDDLMHLMQNEFLAYLMPAMLSELAEKNIVAIFMLSDILKQKTIDPIKNLVKNQFDSKIFMPNPKINKKFQDYFAISYDELHAIENMSFVARNFMIKTSKETIIAELNIAGLHKVINLISCGENCEEKLKIAEEAIAKYGEIPENWLPEFLDQLKKKED